jgi:hypothetical protein
MNERFFAWTIHRAVRRLGVTERVLWLADLENGPALRRLFPDTPSIFHVLDYLTLDPSIDAANRLMERVDLSLAATPGIAAAFASSTRQPHVFRNGWHFTESALASTAPPADLAAIRGPRVGLVSFLGPNLDYGLLWSLVENLAISLVIVGREIGALTQEDRTVLRRLRRHPRVCFLGERSTDTLPAYIRHFAVCIAAYKRSPRIYLSDPLKVYQYLALGRPVISTPVQVLEGQEPVVRIGHTPEEFIGAVAEELQRPEDRELEGRRLAVGRSTHWGQRWRDLEAALSSYPAFRHLTESLEEDRPENPRRGTTSAQGQRHER